MRTITLATLLICLAYASAAEPGFVGSWATEASCPAYDVTMYSETEVSSPHMQCAIEDAAEAAPGQWLLQTVCLYEGAENRVDIELHVAEGGGTMRQTIGSRDLELIRCR
tara:strand:- start:35 stop:364 length:330 start_codon:yes stop_codon:yes gene_type:complete